MKTTIVYPQNELLKKYIKYFLFLKNENPEYTKTHVSYPNTNHCLGLLKNNKIEVENESKLRVVQVYGYNSYLTGIYTKPMHFSYSGVFDEICIDFEPLGLEMVTGKKISNQIFVNSVLEKYFHEDINDIYAAAFNYDDLFKRAEFLEVLFLKLLNQHNKSKFIHFNEIHANTVNDLQSIFKLSYRSVNRLYKENLGISPKDFLNITRIRKNFMELNQMVFSSESAYYDQSHMIRNYKKYTGITPNKFKSKCQVIDNNVWLSID